MIDSLETVVKFFLEKANEYAKDAQSKADQIALDMIEDLEEESLGNLLFKMFNLN